MKVQYSVQFAKDARKLPQHIKYYQEGKCIKNTFKVGV